MYRGYLPRDLLNGSQGAKSLGRLPTAMIACFGSRSRRVNFCIQVLKVLMEIRGKGFDIITGGTETAFRSQWANRKHDRCFIFVASPDNGVAELYMQSGAPFVVFNDDPVEAVCASLEGGTDFLTALRKVSEQLAKNQDLMLSSSAFVVKEQTFLLPFNELMTIFDIHFDQKLSRSELATLANRFDRERKLSQHVSFDEFFALRDSSTGTPSLTKVQEELVEACLSPLSNISFTRPVNIIWPREVFVGSSNNAIKGPIELAGPSRRLITGPNLHVPKGRWVATASFEVGNNDAGNILNIEVCAKTTLMKKRYILPSSGRFSSIIEFEIPQPSSRIELRFSIGVASTAGTFTLHNVGLVRAPLGARSGPRDYSIDGRVRKHLHSQQLSQRQ